MAAFVLGFSLTNNVSVLTVAYLLANSSTNFSASSPIARYSDFMYPSTLPDFILTHSPLVSRISVAQPLYNLPTTSLSVLGFVLILT
jgi:hypothetical protein